jgi:hypothetical protein
MSSKIPKHCPTCAVSVLARREWFDDPEIVTRTRLAEAKGISRLLSSKFFAGQRIAAITLGQTIYFRELDQFDPHSIEGLALLAHEIKHVEQYRKKGFIRFYAKYIWDYIIRRGYGEQLTFEAEASELQRQVRAHLIQEFGSNPDMKMCKEMGDPHTPNEQFAKSIPKVFQFRV